MSKNPPPKGILILDGYNVIKRSPNLRRHLNQSLEAAREALVRHCLDWKALRRDVSQFILVFDGSSEFPTSASAAPPGIRIVYTRTGEQADERILSMLSGLTAKGSVSVVTDDGDVRAKAKAAGADIVPVGEFIGVIARKKKGIIGRGQPEQTSELTPGQEQEITKSLRREWGLERD